jgi:hypothetical protein
VRRRTLARPEGDKLCALSHPLNRPASRRMSAWAPLLPPYLVGSFSSGRRPYPHLRSASSDAWTTPGLFR